MGDEPQLRDVFIDFLPNWPRTDETREMIREQFRKRFEQGLDTSVERVWDLSALALLEPSSPYIALLVEARQLYVEGHFYACVAMCGIVAERLVKDALRATVLVAKDGRAETPGDVAFDQLERVESMGLVGFLEKAGVLEPDAAKAARKIVELRNAYAHARGKNPDADAGKAIAHLQTIVEGTVSMFRDFEIRDGVFVRRTPESPAT